MSRIAQVFQQLQVQSRKALIPFITAGHPHPSCTVPVLHALVQGGADVIELGVPFSDPMADGPVIQRASEQALAQGVSLAQVLAWVAEFRQTNQHTPIVLMGYANPIEAMGIEVFSQAAAQAGVDGVLVVDYPPEESQHFCAVLAKHALDCIFLLAPTSTPQRMAKVAELASGYVYYVSLKGVTGAATLNLQEVAAKVQAIREHTTVPIGVGFGIRDAHTAVQVAQYADAVVIGSALVTALEQAGAENAAEAAQAFLTPVRLGLDQK